MRVHIVQPMMSLQKAPTALSRILQPVQNTAYLLAALVPDGHDVKVTDEYVAPVDPEGDDSDLVGITFVTGFAPRAYDPPDIFDISVEAAEDIALDGASIGVLIPYPGTPVYERLNRDWRIVTRDWGSTTASTWSSVLGG